MKTTFAAASIAAAATALPDLMAVPDFVAGFMFQLTGDNNMTEIEACYSGGDQIVLDAQAALSDIKSGHFIKGAQDFGKIVWDLPDALADCKGMDDDVAALEAYAESFKDVGHITKEVARNWLLHGTKVKADIS